MCPCKAPGDQVLKQEIALVLLVPRSLQVFFLDMPSIFSWKSFQISVIFYDKIFAYLIWICLNHQLQQMNIVNYDFPPELS
jgi:hypothetical protein